MASLNPLRWRSGKLFLGAGACLLLAGAFYASSMAVMFSELRTGLARSRERSRAVLSMKPGDPMPDLPDFDPVPMVIPTLLLSLPSYPLGLMGITGIVLGCIRYSHELKLERDAGTNTARPSGAIAGPSIAQDGFATIWTKA